MKCQGDDKDEPTFMEGLHKTAEEASEDVRGEVCGVDLSAAMAKAIRIVVRDEMSKLFQHISNAMK